MKFSEKVSISKHKYTVWENSTFFNVTESVRVVILQFSFSYQSL